MAVKILFPSLDTVGRHTVLRGTLALDTAHELRIGPYQREQLSRSHNIGITRAIDRGTQLPDVTLGMRGERFEVDADPTQAVSLLDPVFIVDGQQRISTISKHRERYPQDDIRIGACVFFNTDERWEREMFQGLNANRSRMSANVILRNARENLPLLATLYGLTQTDAGFPLYRRVCWTQMTGRDDLISGITYVMVALQLHSHLAAVRVTGAVNAIAALGNLARALGMMTVRNNVSQFWSVVDEAWGIRELGPRATAPYLKTGFLFALTDIISSHRDFWEAPADQVMRIAPDLRRRLAAFKVANPEVVRLASGHGIARETLQILLVNHLNARRQQKLVKRNDDPAPAPPPAPAELGSAAAE